jgi:hypothetical protein
MPSLELYGQPAHELIFPINRYVSSLQFLNTCQDALEPDYNIGIDGSLGTAVVRPQHPHGRFQRPALISVGIIRNIY